MDDFKKFKKAGSVEKREVGSVKGKPDTDAIIGIALRLTVIAALLNILAVTIRWIWDQILEAESSMMP